MRPMRCPLATSGPGRLNHPARLRDHGPLIARFLLFCVAVLVVVLPTSLQTMRAQGDLPPEVQAEIKAHFVYTAAKFVEWPHWAFEGSNAPIVFGVFGSETFLDALNQQTEGKTLIGRPVLVKGFSRLEEIRQCHVLYVAPMELERLRALFSRLRKWSVLTVGEMDHFSESGGALNLHLQEGMVRFDINLEAARLSGLRISSKLAVLGHLVGSGRQPASPRRGQSSGR